MRRRPCATGTSHAELTQKAQMRFPFKSCCEHADVVKTQFRVNRATAGDEWYWLDGNELAPHPATTSSIGAKPRPTSSRRCSSTSGQGNLLLAGRIRHLNRQRSERGRLRNNIRRDLVFDAADLVAQHQLALLQPLHLDQVGAGRHRQGGDRGVEVAVFLLQARQLLPQLAFFVFASSPPLVCFAAGHPARQSPTIIAFSTSAFKRRENPGRSKTLAPICRAAKPGVSSLLR